MHIMYIIRSILFIICFSTISVFAKNNFVTKAAVVDIEAILENSVAIVHIQKSINKISKNIQKELSEKETKLKLIEDDLIKQRGVLSKEKFEKKVSQFNKKVDETKQERHNKKTALEQAHSAAFAKVHNHTVLVIKELSEKYGFNIVFPSTQAIFVQDNLNITKEVITRLNEKLKFVEIEYQSKILNK